MCKTEVFEISLRGVSPTELLLGLCFGRPLARPKEQACLMVVGLPNVARSSQDLESEVGTHVGRPFVPSTPNQGFMRCPDGFWGMLRNSGIMATHIPACEAHTAVYTFGPDILCCLTFGPAILCIPACEAHTAAGYSSHLAALLPISLLVNSAAS